jgi:nucleotide-binding universal stress UspA family protein
MEQASHTGQKIVVGIDGSANAAAALGWAIDEAGATGASVEAVFVWQEPNMAYGYPGYIPGYVSVLPADIEKMGQHALDAALQVIPEISDVKVVLRAAAGSPVAVLTQASEEPDVSIIAVGTRGHGGVAGLLLGSVSHAMTHHCKKPLAVIPADWLDIYPERARQRIVVGVDGSEESKLALRWATATAAARGVPVEAVMVWSSPSPVLPAHVPLRALGLAGQESKVEADLHALVADVGTDGVQIDCTVLPGHPASTLLERAGTAQMLVVGSRGLGRAHATISGSVSHACTNHASLPIVVVPSRR